MKFLRKFIPALSTEILFIIIVGVGFLPLLLGIQFRKAQNRGTFNLIDFVFMSSAFFIWGWMGIVGIVRKEFFQFGRRFTGRYAVILATIVLILSWGLAFLFLISGLIFT